MVFTTEGLFEVATESWPEWDLNPQPLNFIETLYPTKLSGHIYIYIYIYIYANIIIIIFIIIIITIVITITVIIIFHIFPC